jgi:hypothetical protein
MDLVRRACTLAFAAWMLICDARDAAMFNGLVEASAETRDPLSHMAFTRYALRLTNLV